MIFSVKIFRGTRLLTVRHCPGFLIGPTRGRVEQKYDNYIRIYR